MQKPPKQKLMKLHTNAKTTKSSVRDRDKYRVLQLVRHQLVKTAYYNLCHLVRFQVKIH
jgi:hypothetical protein